MSTPYTECKRCHWEYMQNLSFCRRQPWTDDDEALTFQSCGRCGKISIQQSDATGGTVGVWLLHPDAEVMFRVGTAPSHVFDYIYTDDFLKNRGITRGLFRGYLRSMLDLSGAVNVLVSRLRRTDSLERVQLSMDLFRDLLSEHAHRLVDEAEAENRRLAVSTLIPVTELVYSARHLDGRATDARVDLRFTSLQVLEAFALPGMWASVPQSETAEIERAIDHLTMVEASIARLGYLAQSLDDEALVDAYVEGKFLYRVFNHRKAWLSRAHAQAVWRLMHAIMQIYPLGGPFDMATRAYEALRALLEHQLVESGFFKLGPRDQNGTPCHAFRSQRTGEVLVLPLYYPRLAIFADAGALNPSAVLEDWDGAVARLSAGPTG